MPIPKSIASASLLAFIIVSKFIDALPLYRLSQMFKRLGIDIPRNSMARWLIKVHELIIPLNNLIKEDILSSQLIGVDETRVQVLKEKGRDPTKKSFMWVIGNYNKESPAVIFEYHQSRGGDVPKKILEDYKGYLISDGYQVYDGIGKLPDIIHLGCLAHARRKFKDALDARPDKKKTGLAAEGLKFIQDIYAVENECEIKNPDEIVKIRMEKAKPIWDDLKKWLDLNKSSAPPRLNLFLVLT